MQLTDVLIWIEGAPPIRFIAATPFVYPAISALHIIGIALVFGSIAPVDLRLLRILGPRFDPVLPSLVRNALIGFAVAAPTGLLLASVRIGDYAENPAFLMKMLILMVAGGNALLLRRLAGARSIPETVGRPAGRIAATASLSLWVSAVLAGRWIAFV
ncbi:hypothetical protein [Rhizobium sp. BT-175]|uniref:hypothetical protein n=1 Tax=Rhizobium sp. BT-175 TaxID=2986929 RepID=UPI00223691A1|nr:hypothetical protein [Rhizobium sp. BT-175]MCV9947600.1 hypothetical protein [Rhizobium sp. BT-175]